MSSAHCALCPAFISTVREPHSEQKRTVRCHRARPAAAASSPASARRISGATDLASATTTSPAPVLFFSRRSTADRTAASIAPGVTSAQNTGAPSRALNPRKLSAPRSSASSGTSRTAASAGRHRTCDSRSDSDRASSSSGKIHTFVPDRGRSTASGDAAAAAIASGFALSSDARSASESAKKGTPSSPTNEAPEAAGGEITARAETARRAGGHEGDRSPARDAERGGARCARALGGVVAAAPDIVECAVGLCADRRPNENV